MKKQYGYGDIKLLAGSASTALAEEISDYLKVPLESYDLIEFPNENLFVRLNSSIRGQDVYLIQTMCSPVHRNIMELLITIDCLNRDSAGRITAVFPYMAYARSDKKDQPRVPISARMIADMIEVAGTDRYITIDLHAGQIQGFFSIPGDVLTAFHILSDYFVSKHLKDAVVATADLGFAKKGRNFAEKLGLPLAFVEKRRRGDHPRARATNVIGSVDAHGWIDVRSRGNRERTRRQRRLSFLHPRAFRSTGVRGIGQFAHQGNRHHQHNPASEGKDPAQYESLVRGTPSGGSDPACA
ncbi:MAG: ribose-phosphate diphosphokinase [Anaerolineales bacterium]